MSKSSVRTFPPSTQHEIDLSFPTQPNVESSRKEMSMPLSSPTSYGEAYQQFNGKGVKQIWPSLSVAGQSPCPHWNQWAFIDALLSSCEKQCACVGAPSLKKLTLIKRLLQSLLTPSHKIQLRQVGNDEQDFVGRILSIASKIQSTSSTDQHPLSSQVSALMESLSAILSLPPKMGREQIQYTSKELESFFCFQGSLSEFILDWLSYRLTLLIQKSRQARELL